MAELHGEASSLVRSRDPGRLAGALVAAGLRCTPGSDGVVTVFGGDLVQIGEVALRAGIAVHELRAQDTDLEALFFELTEAPGNQNRNLGPVQATDEGGAS
jgi:ABC-2 type transport system ATP-binding protein